MLRLITSALLSASTCAEASECVHDRNQPAPYYYAGTLVTPQSNVIVIGDCNQTYETLNNAYLASPKRGGPVVNYAVPAPSPSTSAAAPASTQGTTCQASGSDAGGSTSCN
jgi:hypothetical protein